MEERIQELLDFAAEEGIALPVSPEWIVAIEDAGGVVDLTTGRAFILDAEETPQPAA